MSAHAAGCARGRWLLEQPKAGLFWVVLFQEGPACTCGAGDCSRVNSRRPCGQSGASAD